MSAEVILMNKNGIAIAADSAVTIGNKTKIYNTADKMFTLSKHAPVGILIYNSSSFMGIQLELIVKEYRKKIGENKFDTLAEYVEDFKKFCIEFINEYAQKDLEMKNINVQIFRICDFIFKILSDFGVKEMGTRSITTDEELINFHNLKLDEILNKMDQKEINDFMSNEYYEKVSPKFDIDNIITINENEYKIKLNDDNKIKLKEKLANYIRNLNMWDKSEYSGIAITGYGEKEIFPSCIKFDIMGMMDNELIYLNKETYEITHKNDAAIVALAQTDVMDEFFIGVNSEIEDEYAKIYSNKINSVDDDKKSAIEELRDEMIEKRKSIATERRKNIFKSLTFLPREEMIYMAEGMINLTSFKRRLVLDNYSQTVGGPIDLAYISKGDGFIWIKRKQYFDKELNYVFTENYFKKKGDGHE